MKLVHSFSLLGAALFGVLTVSVQATPDLENTEIVTHPTTGDQILRWQGQQDRIYFVQCSDPNFPLELWDWVPLIETGSGVPIEHVIEGNPPRAFFRLWYTDEQPPPGVSVDDWDMDGDGRSNIDEVWPWPDEPSSNPFEPDTDGDGLPDGWEVSNGLDPNDATGTKGAAGDPDVDGLNNAQELALGTHPREHDTDGDGLPDGWEHIHQFDPTKTDGVDGATGDPDGDDLENLDEYLNGCDPRNPDSDGDGIDDGDEVNQASDPVDASDGGAAPVEHVEEVAFEIYGDWASWRMEIQGAGPDDNRKLLVSSPAAGEQAIRQHKLRRGNKYEITLHHTGTAPWADEEWYCWEARIEDGPGVATFEDLPDYQVGSRNDDGTFFSVRKHWLVDNRDGLLTDHIHSKGNNVAGPLRATMVPVSIRDNVEATGVDAISIMADPTDIGHQDDFWIVAHNGGPDYNNDAIFEIPVDPNTSLTMSCPNTLIAPETATIGTPEPTVNWRGTSTETSDESPVFLAGPQQELVDLAIRAKVMKKRTVNVTCYRVRELGSSFSHVTCGEAALEWELNRTCGYQINAYFAVTIQSGVTEVDYDLDGDGWLLACNPNQHISAEELAMVAAVTLDPDADIHVFYAGKWINFPGAIPPGTGEENKANGATPIENDKVFLSPRDGYMLESHAISVLSHEIGHVMAGPGHPDQASGPAPLASVPSAGRRMHSAARYHPDYRLLVKAEWDNAENWLKARPNGDN